jgi:hypothetical protein
MELPMRTAPRHCLIAAAVLAGLVPVADARAFSTPDNATEFVRAKELPFKLHFDPDVWSVQPKQSNLRLLARVVPQQGSASGAFTYREQQLSPAELRQRERDELASAFASHEIAGFEARTVNGEEVMLMRARATTSEGREVVIRSYLWAGPNGVADYGIVTNAEAFADRREAIIGLLNGLEIHPDAEQTT